MARRLRRLTLVALATVLFGGVVALVLAARSDLGDARADATVAWDRLQPSLEPRYGALAAANDAVRQADPEGERAVVADLDVALRDWGEAIDNGSLSTRVDAANALEGLARRLMVAVAASARLQAANPELPALAAAPFGAVPPAEAVGAYDDASQRYDDARRSLRRRLVADTLGFDPAPAYVAVAPVPVQPSA